jgi:hypothetical protein
VVVGQRRRRLAAATRSWIVQLKQYIQQIQYNSKIMNCPTETIYSTDKIQALDELRQKQLFRELFICSKTEEHCQT